MKSSAYHILRVGMAITFLWIGVLIFRDPAGWGTLLRPWAVKLLPVPLTQAMLGTAVLDSLIGFLLLVDAFSWGAAIIGAAHLAIVLTTVGIDAITVRDVGLLAGCLSLTAATWPEKLRFWKKRGLPR